MSKKTFIKWLIICLLLALSFSALSFLFMNRFAETSWSRPRQEFILLFADNIERKTQALSLEEIKNIKVDEFMFRDFFHHPHGPPPPEDMPPPPPPPESSPNGPHGPRHSPFSSLHWWVIDEHGEVLLKNMDEEAPEVSIKPTKIHEVVSDVDFFRLFPSISIIKLDRNPDLFFIAKETRRPFSTPLIFFQTLFTFGTIAASLGFALLLMFLYLRKKSEEARSVLKKLGEGDLKARFEVQKIDEFGGLLLDFNRMAEEIEKLVVRIHSVERTRKNLLQELGHDLRTPLTSLKTSIETLRTHFQKMSNEDREDLLKLINGEVDYFKDLIEKLMTVASLDEPNYKKTTEVIDLYKVLDKEFQSRQTSSVNTLSWILQPSTINGYLIHGDSHLILRMFRNALDNSSRYACKEIKAILQKTNGVISIAIQDDGPGFDQEGLSSFGQRREFRGRSREAGKHFSIGLGSVIMRTIAELHGGQVRAQNIESNGKINGASIVFELPSSKS